jgi:hypothetical protein
MMITDSVMTTPLRQRISVLLTVGCVLGFLAQCGAKSYGSGHSHSYSSHSSSHSYSSGGFHSSGGPSHSSGGISFSSGGGHSYGSGPSKSGSDGHSYTSSKSYGSGGGPARSSSPAPPSGSGKNYSSPSSPAGTKPSSAPADKGFSFDQAAARADKQESSKRDFTQYKDAQNPRPAAPPAGAANPSSYGGRPPPIPSSYNSRATVYVPDRQVIITRPVRIYSFFNPYYSRPWIVYNDPYSSLFWWWLLDRSLDDRAYWAYHHRYDMDPARYDALLAADQQLSARVADLEAQQAARDPSYTPPGLDRDLMYSDHYVANTYSNRPTFFGVAAFRILIIGGGLAMCFTFIWLIWFKRWQTAT